MPSASDSAEAAAAASVPRRVERGPAVAGVEVAAGAVRAVVGRREDGRLRVIAASNAPLPKGAVSGGLVVDRAACGQAIATALGIAESRERATRVLLAIDGDDVRTYHVATTFERTSAEEPIQASEVQRAIREAREHAVQTARTAASEDPAMRGTATVQLDTQIAGALLDGRPLRRLEGFHGRSVVVHTDVSLAPLLHGGAVAGALAVAKRRAGTTCGAYVLARLLAESGFTDGGVLRLGADLTAFAIVRDGRVVATRSFGLGRDELLGRVEGAKAADDAAVWASCVLAPNDAVEGQYPARWYFVGVPDELVALPRALGNALARQRGGAADISPLGAPAATRLSTDGQLHADHLVAGGAAAIAAEIF